MIGLPPEHEISRLSALERRVRALERAQSFGYRAQRTHMSAATNLWPSNTYIPLITQTIFVPANAWVMFAAGYTPHFGITGSKFWITDIDIMIRETTDPNDPIYSGVLAFGGRRGTGADGTQANNAILLGTINAAHSVALYSSPRAGSSGSPSNDGEKWPSLPFVYRPITTGLRTYELYAVAVRDVSSPYADAFINAAWLELEVS